jgi:NAD(P)-dependent dehydrogenase (short-subunit alcohol dehydrogenase family)
MRPILVTGANKGIGLAIATAILETYEDTFVFLGSRDRARGEEVVKARPAWASRIEVVALDVASQASVEAARAQVAARGGGLFGLVNNAGIGTGAGASLAEVLGVNVLGVRRVCEAFLPLMAKGGRIVNVTSASGPLFVADCSEEKRRFFVDPNITWPRLSAFIDECIAMDGDRAAFEAAGLGDGGAYGLSKACANAYTVLLAREHPELRIHACTPGFIETDMTRHYVASQGKPPAALGMKPPSEGAKTPMFLLFGEPEGNGRYFGSDAKRSPLDRYRAPGAPPYDGP